jgi:phytoene desaturase
LKKVIVIGAGLGGISAAIRMAVKGYQVTVFEASNHPGGKMNSLQMNAYRFDTGPSLFTMPELVHELFDLAGENINDYLPYQRLEETCRYFFNDKTIINGYSEIDKFAAEVQKKTSVENKDVITYLRKSKFIYDTTAYLFLNQSLHKLKTFLSLKVLFSMLKIPFLGVFKSMNQANTDQLKDEKIVQLFNRFATYNGSNPFLAPAILNIIPHLEFSKGAYFPDNGMYSIADALFKLAKKLGVKFEFDKKVNSIETANNKTIGIKTDNTIFHSDLIICNADIYFTYKHLLKQAVKAQKVLKQERSTSALIFYWGIKKEFKNLELHNILFSGDYKNEFSCLQKGTISNDPTVYINITSKKNKRDAPKGCENWFVMINVPSDNNQKWDELIEESKKNIIRKINASLHTDIASFIDVEQVLEPRLIETMTGSFKGSLYGTSSNSKMAAFFRHPNFAKQYNNLYFCGGSVHPGGGIPLALSSAKIVDSLIPPN